MLHKSVPLGIYEKALPPGEDWLTRLQLAGELGFDFVEMSIDESDGRLARLDWSAEQRLALVSAVAASGVRVPSLCLSAHRRFPLGSADDTTRDRGLEIVRKAIRLAQDTGIRVIQLAGYDVYYQQSTAQTRARFRAGLAQAVEMASCAQVMLAMEIMDYPLMNSISKALGYAHYLNNPWFQLYPDIGNLSAWDNDVPMELMAGRGHIVAVHVKDTRPGSLRMCRSARAWSISCAVSKRCCRAAIAAPICSRCGARKRTIRCGRCGRREPGWLNAWSRPGWK